MTTQKTTHLTLDKILARIGAAGLRLDHMNAVEAGAGNISVSVTADADELGLAEHLPQAPAQDAAYATLPARPRRMCPLS